MNRILLDVSVHQTRIAVVEEGELVELLLDSKDDESIVGNIYMGRVSNVLTGMQSAFVDIGQSKNAYLYYGNKKDSDDKSIIKPKVGEEIMVQVEKAQTSSKGALVTSKISFPGKFIVLIPNDNSIGISQKIVSVGERSRIKEIAKELLPANYGMIIRTGGVGKNEEDFKLEIDKILKISESVVNKGKYVKAPAVIHKDFSPVIKAARELLTDDVNEFIVNGKEEFEMLKEITKEYGDSSKKILLYEKNVPIFENYFIEGQVEKAFNKKVWLKSGGFLIIEQTEACVVIDVNTGKYIGKKDLESTIIKTNLEAALEVAKQLKLKNLSGIIIVDFIDLKNDEDKKYLRRVLEEAVKSDRTKTVVVGMTELGLMQITRKKTRPSILMQMTTLCLTCGGIGRVPTVQWTVGEIRRQIISIFVQTIFDEVTIKGDIRLLNAFCGVGNQFKNMIESEYGKKINLEPLEGAIFGHYEIERKKS